MKIQKGALDLNTALMLEHVDIQERCAILGRSWHAGLLDMLVCKLVCKASIFGITLLNKVSILGICWYVGLVVIVEALQPRQFTT